MMYVCGNSLTECCNLFSQQVSIPSLPTHSDATTTTSKSTLAKSGEYSYVCVTLAWSVSYSNEYGDNWRAGASRTTGTIISGCRNVLRNSK